MINKRQLYESLYRSFYPESIVAFATINGYRVCANDPEMIDYDLLYAIDAKVESNTWVEISVLSKTPRVVLRINEFHAKYDLGLNLNEIIQQYPSYNKLPIEEQEWIKKTHSAITQAFVAVGWQFC